jgi:two-component system, NtrC family, response regulator HydG
MAGETRVKVMVVEDDPEVARTIARKLGADGLEVELADDPRPVLARLDAGEASDWDVVLLDVGLPGMSGIDVLRRFREASSLASIVMLTGDNSANTATTCMRAGAFYYLTKPFRPFELSSMVESAARYATLRRELAGVRQAIDEASDQLLVGTSPAMRKLRAALDRLASQDVSILIRGESGTGKELVARALHDRGSRRKRRFVALNCGAIPESLIDSELFGHAKGAFTGATTDRAGVFVEADGGTLFLDEIGDMPMAVQARLLRVLQEGEVRPVGGSGVRSVDVRVIAATHVDLTTAVEQTRFRQDLFYRLNVVVLSVPPLRDRLEDLPVLAAHFLRKHGRAVAMSLSPDALDAMMSYAWPGNVRELENAIMHAMALHQGDVIVPESLPSALTARGNGRAPATVLGVGVGVGVGVVDDDGQLPPLTEAKRRASAVFEKNYLTTAMERAKGSISEAARLAGLDRTNFRRLLQRHSIDATTFKG